MTIFNELDNKLQGAAMMHKIAKKHEEEAAKKLAAKQKAEQEAHDHKNKAL